jgi:hypothetical protein
VQRERIVSGITTGTIPAAATFGMLLGFGVRLGEPARVLDAIGAIAVGAQAYGAIRAPHVVLGVLLNIVAMLSCGVAYVSLIGEAREHRAAWAIAVAAMAVAAAFVSARTFAGSIALVLTPANLIAIGVVIAITLPIGMRLAPSRV